MDHEIERVPAILQRRECNIERSIVGHIDIEHDIRTDALRQRFKTRAERFALIGEGEVGTSLGTGLGNAPGNRPFVGDAHYEPAFS